MLTCFCGNILISSGKVWECPIKGEKTAFDKQDRHVGVVVPDRRYKPEE